MSAITDTLKRELGKGNSSQEEWATLRASLVRDAVREIDTRGAALAMVREAYAKATAEYDTSHTYESDAEITDALLTELGEALSLVTGPDGEAL